ncbi:MAG: sulfite exporter TauE/SafE family protein [Verrucomicrobia bacterium]|nr:MAG: sulfite exporter TauE/SafE family protein [Verrucomicrobiota bacterium]
MLVAFTGFLAGFTHVLSGPDHLAAVTPLAVESHRDSWRSGFRWGLGHSAGVAVVGLMAFALREAMPLERISAWSERLVGVVLVGVGLWAVRRALRIRIHTHWHEHGGQTHQHVHLHAPPESGRSPVGTAVHRHTHAAFGIGTLHGLAGSSHFFGVLPALALPDAWHAGAYLLAFGLGTVAAMSGFAAVFGRVAGWFALSHLEAYRGLMYASATAALGVGGWWLWQAG